MDNIVHVVVRPDVMLEERDEKRRGEAKIEDACKEEGRRAVSWAAVKEKRRSSRGIGTGRLIG